MDRCPACRARLGDADICTRCGADFSISRRAERQARRLVQIAVRELLLGETKNAAVAAEAAAGLASPLLARAVTRMILRRESNLAGVVVGAPEENAPIPYARDTPGVPECLKRDTGLIGLF